MNLDAKIAHLGFIQGIINRMGAKSFLLKACSITLVSAILALSSKDANQNFVLLVFFPVIVFWMLDAYFLYQEKLFRKLFKEVATDHISSEFFILDTLPLRENVVSYAQVLFSTTLLLFHGPIVIIVLFAIFFLLKL